MTAGYPIIFNGDHAEFERLEAIKGNPTLRADWPLPSFDARDWAQAFCKQFTVTPRSLDVHENDQEGLMIGWFANALMRGFDEHASRATPAADQPAVDEAAIIERCAGEADKLSARLGNPQCHGAHKAAVAIRALQHQRKGGE
jgi:hypothetical protein